MTAADETPEFEAGRKELREFGLVTGAMVAAIFGLFFPWLLEHSWPVWPWIVFAVLGAWGLIAPLSLAPVFRGWMRLGHQLSKITTPLIMGLVFFLAVTPMALIIKLLGKDSIARSFDASAQTYRVPSKKPRKAGMENPF
jgi:hypothetical protein